MMKNDLTREKGVLMDGRREEETETAEATTCQHLLKSGSTLDTRLPQYYTFFVFVSSLPLRSKHVSRVVSLSVCL